LNVFEINFFSDRVYSKFPWGIDKLDFPSF
jgi:hypothetical protein